MILLFGCASPCEERRGETTTLAEAVTAEASAMRVLAWAGGELVLWAQEDGVHALELTEDGEAREEVLTDETDLAGAAASDEQLLVFSMRFADAVHLHRFDRALVGLADTELTDFGTDVTAVDVVWTGEVFAGVVASWPSRFVRIDAEGAVDMTSAGRAVEEVSPRLAWNGDRIAGGHSGVPAFVSFDEDDEHEVRGELPSFAGVSTAPVWTGTQWLFVAGSITDATFHEDGGVVVVAGFRGLDPEPLGLESLVGNRTAPTESVAAAWDPAADGGVVVWGEDERAYAVGIDPGLRAEGCPCYAAWDAETEVLSTRRDGTDVSTLVLAGRSLERWTTEIE